MATTRSVPSRNSGAEEQHVRFDVGWLALAEPMRSCLLRKLSMTMFFVVALMAAAFGAECVRVVKVANHYPWDGKVDCSYSLAGLESGYRYKGVFTLTVEKGDVTLSRVVTNIFSSVDGNYMSTFDCTSLFGEGFYPNGGLSLDLVRSELPADASGVPIGVTGDVLVIDISGGSVAPAYSTIEYSAVDMGTFNCNTYKTDKIVLRKVPAGSYYCQPRAWSASTCDDVATQKLTTQGFYIGVYPVTQRQYELVMGENPSAKTNAADDVVAHRPVECITWNLIRGGVAVDAPITASSPDSFLKRLVAKTGLPGFDLPTEAQWEIACRANAPGAFGSYWNGSHEVVLVESGIGEVAWYSDNSSLRTHAVGGKFPNMWGLYDMLGNVVEVCRDLYISAYNATYVDVPCAEVVAYAAGTCVVIHGFGWGYASGNLRPSSRDMTAQWALDFRNGFRLMKALP